MPDPDIIGSVEATDILKCDRSSVSRWVASGRLTPAHKLPGKTGSYLFRRTDVETLRDELLAVENEEAS